MKSTDLVVKAQIIINASVDKIWDVLTDPLKVKQYTFYFDVQSDFKPGSNIKLAGKWKGKELVGKGTILNVEPGKLLRYNFFHLQSGKADIKENYHTITIALSKIWEQTNVALLQENNVSKKMVVHFQKSCEMILEKLKSVVEKNNALYYN